MRKRCVLKWIHRISQTAQDRGYGIGPIFLDGEDMEQMQICTRCDRVVVADTLAPVKCVNGAFTQFSNVPND
ncbi:hypothetical protein GWI33_013894 [Rhynchophorus ferrugineus]|uniref:Uncharacterized protein n=1 Tax=Rhynchophorus ferrugineus TaxID=354439 RepID=A0A834I666_RHYFE|nr:hypothetical protein GWI33_013894 [Rhynchophorus ferrugineus]